MPLAIICRSFILLKPIIDVSDAEKKNDKSARAKISIIFGKDSVEFIFSLCATGYIYSARYPGAGR